MVSQPRSVQSSRWDGAIFLIIPGTSCLATIVLSLRDKSICLARKTRTISPYRPRNAGGRFSKNAATPSRASWVWTMLIKAASSIARPSSIDASMPR
jgi:hypothetical protein